MLTAEEFDANPGAAITAQGYTFPRRLQAGPWAAVGQYLGHAHIFSGFYWLGYLARYRYASKEQALAELDRWWGNDAPGGWLDRWPPVYETPSPEYGDVLRPKLWRERW